MTHVEFLLVSFLVFSALLSAVYLDTVEPIGCYLCNSSTDKNSTVCIDPMTPFPDINTTVCDGTYVCTRVSYITNKKLVVSRGCDPGNTGDTCKNIHDDLIRYYPDLAAFNCYNCSTNWCNDASSLNANHTVKNKLRLTSHRSL